MAVLPKTPRKKPKAPRRPKTGLAACPVDSFIKAKWFFQYEVDAKDVSSLTKGYIKKTFSKDDAKAILAHPEFNFTMYTHWGATIQWMNLGLTDELFEQYASRIKSHFEDLIESGREIISSKEEITESNVIRLTPQQLIARKINDTVMVDIDELEDQWIAGEKTKLSMYEAFQKHDLKGVAVAPVRARLYTMLSEYEDALNKTCEDAVEAFAHLTRPEVKRRVTALKEMIADLDKFKAATKAVRKVRTPKTRAADKQIGSLKYLKESNEYKVMSINPIQVPGSVRMYTFNAKTRMLTEYVTDSPTGFEVKGTTLQKFDEKASRCTRLRKPDEFLAIVLSKTPNQINNAWNKLTTKTTEPNGRINVDTVLLRVLDK